MTFDPYDLSADVNLDSVEAALNNARYSEAVMMSFKLNEKKLIGRGLEAVPADDSKCIIWRFFESGGIGKGLFCVGKGLYER